MCIFGEIVNGVMHLNEAGHIVAWTWQDLPNHVPNGIWDAFVVMRNPVHGTIIITSRTPATKSYGLPEIVCQFKKFSARRTNDLRGTPIPPSGNATIANISYAAKNPFIASAIILSQIPCAGT